MDFDPDEQARDVIRLVFDKFDELGSIYGLFHWLIRNDIRLPIRPRTGAKKGQLDWRRPSIPTLAQMLRHPIYAGAYATVVDPSIRNGKFSPGNRHRPWVPMEQWKVLLKDRLPAYITWEHYLKNRERIKQNRNGPIPRACRAPGRRCLPACWSAAIAAGRCRPLITPMARPSTPVIASMSKATEPRCYGLAARAIDDLVAQQVLRALEPAAVDLSLQAHADVEQERQRLDKHWQQRRQRARYDVELAERRYQAVDPENRLVAATLEKRWEEALAQEKQLQEEYDRFLRETPVGLSDEERARITALTSDIPALWNAPGTTNVDRKQMMRCLVERVVVQVRCDSEFVDVTIHWAGGYESQHEIVRPVATYAQLRDFEPLMDRVVELREAGHTAPEIAEGTERGGILSAQAKRQVYHAGGLPVAQAPRPDRQRAVSRRVARPDEWWLTDLARELQMSHLKLRDWANRGWVHSRKTPVQGYWILWADKDEVRRLRKLLAESRRGVNAYASELRTPKKRGRAK